MQVTRLKRDLALTLLLQAGGGAATLLAALWIGKALGPAQQGQFNQVKALVDLGAALAALGMPQALYVLAQQGRVSLPRARRVAWRVAVLGLLVGALLGAVQPGLGGWPLAAVLACGVALATLQAQWRALVLLGRATWRFNLVTVAPQWLLLPVAAVVVGSGGMPMMAMAVGLAVVWALACAQAAQALASVPAPVARGVPASGPGLLRHGLATWVAATAASGAIVLLQWQAAQVAGAAGLGRFALALLLVQLPLTPLNYAVPLLLRHRLLGQGAPMGRRLPWVLLPVLLLAGVVALVGVWHSDLGMGAAYAGLHQVLAWLLLAGAAEAGVRLAAVDSQAEGRPMRTAWAEGLRVLLLTLACLMGLADSLVHLAVVWAAVSGLALLLLWLLGRRPMAPDGDQALTAPGPGPDQRGAPSPHEPQERVDPSMPLAPHGRQRPRQPPHPLHQPVHVALLGQANSVHLQRWAEALHARGRRVSVLSQQVDDALPLSPGIAWVPLARQGMAGYFLNAWAVRRWLRTHRPDLLHAHYASGYGSTAMLAGFQPLLLSVWGSDVYEFPYQGRAQAWLLRRNLQAADLVASTSAAMAGQVRRLWPEAGPIAVTPFGVDLVQFSPAVPDAVTPRPITIGTVKTLAHAYGIDTLLRAFAQLGRSTPARLLVVGDGPQRAELQALAEELGLGERIEWAGAVPHADVPRWLQRLDIYVAASRSESFGVAVVEAMACGLPVVVSDAGGLPEVLGTEPCGLIVPRDDPSALAQALRQLLDNAPLRRRLAEAGRARVEAEYAWPRCIDRMLQAQDAAIAQAGRRGAQGAPP